MGSTRDSQFIPQKPVRSKTTVQLRARYYRWGLMMAAHIVGPEASVRLTRRVGRFLWERVPAYRRAMRKGVAAAFTHKLNESQVEELARRCATEVLVSLIQAEFIHRKLRVNTWPNHVRHVNFEQLFERTAQGGGVIAAGTYLGNFQAGVTAMTYALPGRVSAIVAPLQFLTQQRWMAGLVTHRLARLYPREGAISNSLRALREGNVVFMMSEHYGSGEGTVAVDFLGARRNFYPSPAILAVRANCPIAVVTCHRLDGTLQFEGRVRDWIEPPTRCWRREWVHDTTVRILKVIEGAIYEHPEQYSWPSPHPMTGDPPESKPTDK